MLPMLHQTYRPMLYLLVTVALSFTACASDTAEQAQRTEVVPTSMETAAVSTAAERYTNARYKFSVDYPAGWTMEISENADGATFYHPDNEAVYISVSGSQPITEILPGEKELDNWENEKLLYDDFKLIKEDLVAFQNNALTPKGYAVDGRAGALRAESAIFDYEEDDLDLDLRVQQFKVLADDRTVTVYMETPRHLADDFAGVYQQMLRSLVLD